jgi:hypothetical protein
MDAMLIGLVAVATVTGVAVLPWSELAQAQSWTAWSTAAQTVKRLVRG